MHVGGAVTRVLRFKPTRPPYGTRAARINQSEIVRILIITLFQRTPHYALSVFMFFVWSTCARCSCARGNRKNDRGERGEKNLKLISSGPCTAAFKPHPRAPKQRAAATATMRVLIPWCTYNIFKNGHNNTQFVYDALGTSKQWYRCYYLFVLKYPIRTICAL